MKNSIKLIEGGRIFDLDGDVDHPPTADILVENGRISSIGTEAAERGAVLDNVERIAADGKLIIPGLVNAHYHSHDVLFRGLYEQLPLDIWGLYSFPANYSRRSDGEVHLRTLLGAAECLTNGITTFQDMVTIVGPDKAHANAVLSAYEESGGRVVLALQIGDRGATEAVPYWDELPDPIQAQLPKAQDPSAMLDFAEELLETVSAPRLSWALGPSAPQRCSDALLNWASRLSRERGLQVFTHLYEARSQAVLARSRYDRGSLVNHLDQFGLLGPRLTIAHGVWMSDEEVAQFGAAGANLAVNSMSNMKLLNGFAPIRRYFEAGAGLALGCDNCSGNDVQSLFQSMKMFALAWGLQTAAGESGAARQAFRAATIGGARALGLEGQVGCLRPGYRADMVFIDLNEACYRPLNSALKQLVYGETGTGIRAVMVDGEMVVQDRRLIALSESKLKFEAEAARHALQNEWSTVGSRNARILADLLAAYEKSNAYPLPFDRFSMR